MIRNRLAIIALAAVFLLGSLIFSCKKQEPIDYFPMGIGSYWEYNVLTMLEGKYTKMGKEISKVIGKERVGELESYVVDRFTLEGGVPSFGQYREFLAKTGKGVECTKRAFPLLMQLSSLYPSIQTEIRNSPTEQRFKTNLKEGDSWRWEGIVTLIPVQEEDASRKENQDPNAVPQKPPKIQQVKGKLEYKYLGRETLHILGKDLDCVKLSLFGKSDSGQEMDSKIWYGPNIGRIREEQTFYEGSKKVLYLFELCNYNIDNREAFKEK